MREIMKTLLVSLSLAATGAGVAWSLTSDPRDTILTNVVVLSSNADAKGDRLDVPAPKADRLKIDDAELTGGSALIDYPLGQTSSIVFHRALAVAATN
jgi:hypothetical protein